VTFDLDFPPSTWIVVESLGIYLVMKSRGILLMVGGKWRVSSELHGCCLFLSRKMKIHIQCMI